MPKSKKRKNHKKKLANRNKIINEQTAGVEKMKRQFLNDLIKKEQESGAFDNTSSVSGDDSNTDNLELEGPQI